MHTRSPGCSVWGQDVRVEPARSVQSREHAIDRTKEPNMRVRTIVGACVLVLFQVPVFAQEPATAGRIKIASGSVSIVRAGATIPAQAGQVLYETDAIRTGAD